MQFFMRNRVILLAAVMSLLCCAWPTVNLGGGAGAGVSGECPSELIAQDAWNFNERVVGGFGPPHYKYENQGTQDFSDAMGCGYNGSTTRPVCPTDQPSGGPNGTGAVYVDSLASGSHLQVGLMSNARSWQNYSTANEVTVSYHAKATGFGGGYFGGVLNQIVWRQAEFWTGSNGYFGNHNLIVMDVYNAVDLGGSAVPEFSYSGSDTFHVENANSAATGLVGSEWNHFVFVWDGEATAPANDGTYTVYVNGIEVADEPNINGSIPNAGNRWAVGAMYAAHVWYNNDYEIDNLQIFSRAVSGEEAVSLDCDVPDK